MLDDLRAIALFVRTVDLGSFRSVAASFNISPSVVSHHVAKLEEKYGVALLYRSTRKLSLTDDGKRFYEHARKMVFSAGDALNMLTENAQSPHGKLTLSMPGALVRSDLTRKIAQFSSDYPNVSVSLHSSDETIDLIASGIDLALRTGEMKDSMLKSRRIGSIKRKLVCSAGYLKDRPPLSLPSELQNWDWVRLKMLPPIRDFIGPDGERHSVHFKSRIEAGSVEAMHQLAIHGAGVATPPEYLVAEDLDAGRLVHLLPDWTIPDMNIYAVWPPNVSPDSLTVRFINSL